MRIYDEFDEDIARADPKTQRTSKLATILANRIVGSFEDDKSSIIDAAQYISNDLELDVDVQENDEDTLSLAFSSRKYDTVGQITIYPADDGGYSASGGIGGIGDFKYLDIDLFDLVESPSDGGKQQHLPTLEQVIEGVNAVAWGAFDPAFFEV